MTLGDILGSLLEQAPGGAPTPPLPLMVPGGLGPIPPFAPTGPLALPDQAPAQAMPNMPGPETEEGKGTPIDKLIEAIAKLIVSNSKLGGEVQKMVSGEGGPPGAGPAPGPTPSAPAPPALAQAAKPKIGAIPLAGPPAPPLSPPRLG